MKNIILIISLVFASMMNHASPPLPDNTTQHAISQAGAYDLCAASFIPSVDVSTLSILSIPITTYVVSNSFSEDSVSRIPDRLFFSHAPPICGILRNIELLKYDFSLRSAINYYTNEQPNASNSINDPGWSNSCVLGFYTLEIGDHLFVQQDELTHDGVIILAKHHAGGHKFKVTYNGNQEVVFNVAATNENNTSIQVVRLYISLV